MWRTRSTQSDEAAKAKKDLISNAVDAREKGRQVVAGEASTITQVTEAIGQISAAVQSNSASSEESAAVSVELFREVRNLKSTKGRFRLKDGGKEHYPQLPSRQY